MSEAGRGRGRGRARGQIRERERERERGTSSQYRVGEPSTSSGWSQRPHHSSIPSTAAPYARPPQSTQGGIGHAAPRPSTSRGDAPGYSASRSSEPMDVTPYVGGGGDASSLGRGAMRGKRVLPADLLVTRPNDLPTKQGTTGETVRLQANYFKLLSTTDWCLYKYAVDFAPEEDRTFVRKGLLKLHKEKLGAYIFDGGVLYTSHKPTPDKMELFSVRQSDGTNIRITVKFVEEMSKGDYHYLQFFNIIMRKCLSYLNLQLIGRNFFDPQNRVEIREWKFELWPGYFTSIRQHENDILMCAEITHKVMRQETLLGILMNIYNESRQGYQDRFKNEVLGLVVLTRYNNNTYRIDDVDFSVTPTSTFRLRTGEEISYKQYYAQKYRITIKNESQPMLVTRSKPRDRRAGQSELIYLVPELCSPTGLTDRMREDFQLMRALAEHTRVAPRARIDKLLQFNRRLHSVPQVTQEFNEWNLELDNRLVDVPGRILTQEKIYFANGGVQIGQDADWTREFRQRSLLKCQTLKDWIVICTRYAQQQINPFISTLIRVGSGMKFEIKQPSIEYLQDDRSGTYAQILEEILSKRRPQMIFCVVSNNRSERYGAIKKKCCVDRPVLTQVFLQKNLQSKGVMSIATKVAIQMNCKLGGSPWCVEIPAKSLMVIGFDVCHDPQRKGRDFGALVASLDRNLTRYFSVVNVHNNGEELSNHISMNIVLAVQKYQSINKELPERIVIYRDGVGEGQITYVNEFEVQQIRTRLTELYGKQKLQMAFIIVTKRINTRLFLNNGNPLPGTVVDDVITNPVKYDFFIVSQNVRQGTVTPTYYSVIHDTVAMNADRIQRLTYKLTHLYFNWSGTVRVPAPCQYAHKLAFLVSQHLHRSPSLQLDTLLYFL